MHSNIVSDAPGRCAECGMNLVPVKTKHHKHEKHTRHKTRSFLQTFWITVGAGTNVAIESAGIILMKNDPRDEESYSNLRLRPYSCH